MSPDDAQLIAYADGELDALTVKRVERAMADDPSVAAAVEAHRLLRRQLSAAFAPVLAEPTPKQLTAMLDPDVITLAERPRQVAPSRNWLSGLAVAASLLLGVMLGTTWQGSPGSVSGTDELLVARGDLADALESRLASAGGSTKMLASFRNRGGQYCRVFAGQTVGGIACRNSNGWRVLETRASGPGQTSEYRQAGVGDAILLAAAQDMMSGDPLDPAAEKAAVAKGWR